MLNKVCKKLAKKKALNKRYFGEEAMLYNEKRKNHKKWKEEQRLVYKLLKQIEKENKEMTVLDIPVGTGRFFDFYKKLGFSVIGMDISEDMLKEAEKNAQKINLQGNFKKGDITSIKLQNDSCFVVISIRIFNLINFEKFAKSLSEITRVSRKYVVFGIRTHPPASKVFSENAFFESIKLLYKKTARNIKISIRKNYFIHPEKKVISQIKKNKLKIIGKEVVESKSGRWYYIFLLEKQ